MEYGHHHVSTNPLYTDKNSCVLMDFLLGVLAGWTQ